MEEKKMGKYQTSIWMAATSQVENQCHSTEGVALVLEKFHAANQGQMTELGGFLVKSYRYSYYT